MLWLIPFIAVFLLGTGWLVFLYKIKKQDQVIEAITQIFPLAISLLLGVVIFFFQQDWVKDGISVVMKDAIIEEAVIARHEANSALFHIIACSPEIEIIPFLPNTNIKRAASSDLFPRETIRQILSLDSKIDQHNKLMQNSDDKIFSDLGKGLDQAERQKFILDLSSLYAGIYRSADYLIACLEGKSAIDKACD